jgi:MATE family multidrug resistance protein
MSRTALPIVLTQISMMSMGMVDLLMVGHVGIAALAAVALGNIWKIGTLIVAMGVVLGIDPAVSQAHGARDGRAMALALQRGVVIALLASVPVIAMWFFTERLLVACGQDREIAHVAHRWVLVQLPSVPFFLLFTAMRQFLQGRGIVKPALYVAIAANVLNAATNWVFIYGHLGVPALGAVGSGITTCMSTVFMALALFWLIRAAKLHEGAWMPWSRAAFDVRGLLDILHVGLPVGAHYGCEIWAFQIAALWAGLLGAEPLAANTIVLNMASLSFMMPLGIGLAASARVGNLIGAHRARDAQHAAWVALSIGAAVMGLWAIVFVVFRREIPLMYGASPAVVALCAGTFPIAAAFQLFDSTQVVGAGILRGMGRTRATAVFNLLGYYAIGLPLGWWLTFRRGLGLAGIWWGVAVGLAVVALGLLAWIVVRGPATVAGEERVARAD